MKRAMELIYSKSRSLMVKISGEHGIGYAKKPYLFEAEDPEVMNLMRGIKRVF